MVTKRFICQGVPHQKKKHKISDDQMVSGDINTWRRLANIFTAYSLCISHALLTFLLHFLKPQWIKRHTQSLIEGLER